MDSILDPLRRERRYAAHPGPLQKYGKLVHVTENRRRSCVSVYLHPWVRFGFRFGSTAPEGGALAIHSNHSIFMLCTFLHLCRFFTEHKLPHLLAESHRSQFSAQSTARKISNTKHTAPRRTHSLPNDRPVLLETTLRVAGRFCGQQKHSAAIPSFLMRPPSSGSRCTPSRAPP